MLRPSAFLHARMAGGLRCLSQNTAEEAKPLEGKGSYIEFSVGDYRNFLDSILVSKNPKDLPRIEKALSDSVRFYNDVGCSLGTYKDLLNNTAYFKRQIGEKATVNILCNLSNVIKTKQCISSLLGIVVKNGKLDTELINSLNVVEQVKLASVFSESYLDEHAVKLLKDHILPCEYMNHLVLIDVLALPSTLLRKVVEPLENTIRKVPLNYVCSMELLAVIMKILKVCCEVPVDVMSKYLLKLATLLETPHIFNQGRVSFLIKTLERLYAKAPHCLLQGKEDVVVPLHNALGHLLGSYSLDFEQETGIRNAMLKFSEKYTRNMRLENFNYLPSDVKSETLTATVSTVQQYLKNTDYAFDFFSYNKFYINSLQNIMNARQKYVKVLNAVLTGAVKSPGKFEPVISGILADQSVKSVFKVMQRDCFTEVMDFIRNYLAHKSESNLDNMSFVNLAYNCILAKPIISLPKYYKDITDWVHKTFDKQKPKDSLEIIGRYLDIVFSPCMDDVEHYKNLREKLKQGDVAAHIHEKFKECCTGNVEKPLSVIKHFIPAYAHLGSEEQVKEFVDNFHELPSKLLAELEPNELRQLLLLFAKTNVV